MSVLTSRPALRWGVPVAVTAVVLTGGVAGRALIADAGPSLPPRTAAELLVDLQTASLTGLSGTVVQRAQLGLPQLPITMGGQGSSDFSSLVSGTHTLRVWYGGEDRQRIALLGTLGESDLVRNGTDVWIWSSSSNDARHLTLPEGDDADQPLPTDVPVTPQEAADAALAALDPTTEVSTDGTATVAGRSAYELVLRPKDDDSLIGQVRIAIDSEEKVPLRVRVFAQDAPEPSAEIGFSQIAFEMPGDEHFEFQPPQDAEVSEIDPSVLDSAPVDLPTDSEPTLVGSGWTAVLTGESPVELGGEAGSELDALVGALPRVSGDWGSGWLLKSRLFSALVTDDGRFFAGAVTPERLYEVAGQ